MSYDPELHRVAISPRDLIDTAVRNLARRYSEDQVELVSDVDPAAPMVLADQERVGLVLSCLLRNSLAHTRAGGSVAVRAEVCGKQVRFTVSDTGGGIPAAYLERIFMPFFQVPGTEDLGGVGLGLAIAQRIVQAHGGEIRCESEAGRGTTVWFTLAAAVD